MEPVVEITKILTGGLEPDISFVLDVPPKDALERRSLMTGDKQDRFETQGLGFQEILRSAYQFIACNFSNVHQIDGSREPKLVFSDIEKKLDETKCGWKCLSKEP